MRQSRCVMLVALAGLAAAGLACTQKAADEALDATRNVARPALEKAQEAGGNVADKATGIAGDIATRTRDVAATTGEAITDTWITAKVSAKFVDETLLNGSHIDVDTTDHVVTLKGTVASATAKNRAAAIAGGTEGVTRVVNQLVVS